MSERDDNGSDSAQGAGRGKTLSLKRTETSTVRQSFSHGRTKAVVVEKKRTRVAPGGKGEAEAAAPLRAPLEPTVKEAVAEPAQQSRAPELPSRNQARGGVVLRELTAEEKESRTRALTDAKYAEVEARKQAEIDAARRAIEDERMKGEREAAARRKAEEDSRKAAEDETRRRAELEAARRLEKPKEIAEIAPVEATPGIKRKIVAEEDDEAVAKKGKGPAKAPPPA